MEDKVTLIYKLEHPAKINFKNNLSFTFSFSIWRPSFTQIIPPKKRKKYFFYWLFHFLHIFNSRDYSAILVHDKTELIASMLIVPTHFKWTFMHRCDLQFTYVLTSTLYRKQGIGEHMIRFALNKFDKPGRVFWYVTDTSNKASIRLSEKTGFKLAGLGQKKGFLKKLIINQH